MEGIVLLGAISTWHQYAQAVEHCVGLCEVCREFWAKPEPMVLAVDAEVPLLVEVGHAHSYHVKLPKRYAQCIFRSVPLKVVLEEMLESVGPEDGTFELTPFFRFRQVWEEDP